MDQRPEAVPARGFQILGRDISNSFAPNLRTMSNADFFGLGFVLLQFSTKNAGPKAATMLMAEVEIPILEAADEDFPESRADRACLAVSAH